jgi:phosphohistidine phosphatase
VFLFGHNPGISDFAFDYLKSNEYMGEMPTCSVMHIEFKENDWKKFNKKNAVLKQRWCPKKDLITV